MTEPCVTFARAIARRPSRSSVDGLRAIDTGTPDIDAFSREHAAYLRALEEAGVAVTVLPALEAYPDSVFVEDTALCMPGLAVLLRPGAPSRRGEVDAMRPVLESVWRDVHTLDGEGHVEGGDLLVTGREVLAGLSDRTDVAGVEALAAVLAPAGHTVRTVRTPPGVLHFKSDCSLLDAGTVLATARLVASGAFEGYGVIETAPGEEAAANAIRVNDRVLFPSGFPDTAARLRDAGYTVRELPNAEAAKLDGGMSCLSLRFSVTAAAAA